LILLQLGFKSGDQADCDQVLVAVWLMAGFMLEFMV